MLSAGSYVSQGTFWNCFHEGEHGANLVLGECRREAVISRVPAPYVMNRVYFPVHPRSSSGDRVAVPSLENHENKMTWVLRAYHLPVHGASGAAGSICLSFLSPEFLHHLWYPVPPRWRTDLPCNPPEGEWCPGGLGKWAGVGIPS